jgi:uncharacterized protein YqeY
MSIVERIERDFVSAYKNKAETQVAALRMLKAAIKNRQVDLKRPLNEDEVLEVLLKQIKQRQESIDIFTKAGREDLAAKEALELELLRTYQPQPLSDQDLATVVDQAIADLGAATIKDMGRVIQMVMHAHKGRADGKVVSELVQTRLTARRSA